jgi:general secretion pathway protein D
MINLSRARTGGSTRRIGTLMLLVVLLAGCAEQQIRRESQRSIEAGDYEQAVRTLDEGLRRNPESAVLRSGLLQARAEALTRRIAAAAAFRLEGKLDAAQSELERAKALEPQNTRIDALLHELATQRRQDQALAEAKTRLDAKQPQAALRTIEQALKDNPRHSGLLTLQRKVEIEQAQLLPPSGRSALAETRPISLDFRDASLRTVLDVVSRNSGVNFILDRDIRPETRVTVFLRQARVEDALDLIIGTNQLAKKVIDTQTVLVYPNTPEKQREYQEQVVRVFYLASAEAKGAAAFLRAMLRIREPFIDERSNMLALRDSPENIQLAARLIALYDAGEPEVLLEVEVLEVSTTRLTELGIKYPDTFSLTPLPPTGQSGLTLGNVADLNRDRVALGVAGLLINLKSQVGDFNTLANPRIRARNKEKAKVLIGDKIPVITTTTGTGSFVSESVSYLDVGLKLEVEPTIYADDDVAIKLSLEVSTLGTSVKTNSGTLAYQIGTRTATTALRLRDGETQLLGGLINKEERKSSSRVPGLGDLPVLGRLFSSDLDTALRTELLLAITPRILRNIRRPDSNETELWVGTDALPRLRLATAAPAAPEEAAAQSGSGAAVNTGATSGAAQPASAGTPAVPVHASMAVDSAPSANQAMPAPAGPAIQPPGGVVASAKPAFLLRWSGPAETRVGETIDVALGLFQAQGLRGLPVDISYDKSRLQLVDALEGDFFQRGNASTSFSKSLDATGGRARVGVLRNQALGAAGDGTLLTLRFKATAAGPATIRLESAQPISMDAVSAAPAPPVPWTINVR